MTNYERLLDLPLREVLKELNLNSDSERDLLVAVFSDLMSCAFNDIAPCSLCDDVEFGSCATVCNVWLDAEASPDANYSRDAWHNALEEDPPTSDTTLEYQVFIHGADLASQLIFDGEHWLDSDGNHYRVDWWRLLPERPQVIE